MFLSQFVHATTINRIPSKFKKKISEFNKSQRERLRIKHHKRKKKKSDSSYFERAEGSRDKNYSTHDLGVQQYDFLRRFESITSMV